jgi:hypothetical protein
MNRQLLKYKIPHRMEVASNLSANWCSHCGYILPVGAKKVMRCLECNKSAHKECAKLMPHFCGLHPDVADKLVEAFEDQERKLHEREMLEVGAAIPKIGKTDAPTDGPGRISAPSPARDDSTVYGGELPQSKSWAGGNPMMVDPHVEIPSMPSPYVSKQHPQFSSSTPVGRPPVVVPEVNVTLNDFHFISVLGRGAFGKVMLASDKITGKYYAIKALKKEFIIQSEDVKRYGLSFNGIVRNWRKGYFRRLLLRIIHSS